MFIHVESSHLRTELFFVFKSTLLSFWFFESFIYVCFSPTVFFGIILSPSSLLHLLSCSFVGASFLALCLERSSNWSRAAW